MSLQSLSLVLACVGTLLALANQVQRWLEKRSEGTVEEHRLDIDGLRTLAGELRTQLDREQGARQAAERMLAEDQRNSRARIADLEAKVDELSRDLRKAHDAVDALRIEREMRRT